MRKELERLDSAKTGPESPGVIEARKQYHEFLAADPDSGTVIVWPAGTKVRGRGTKIRITSQGTTVRLGQRITGGRTLGHDLSGIREKLPKECRSMKLLRVGLNE